MGPTFQLVLGRTRLLYGGGSFSQTMVSFILRRTVQAILSLFVVLTLLFFMVAILPGDAALLAGDPRLAKDLEGLERMRARWGLDQPIHVRYVRYLSSLIRGDLGTSIRTRQRVSVLLTRALPATLKLVGLACLIAVLGGMFLGCIAAFYRGSILDASAMVGAVIGVSMPGFWVGLMLIYIFAVRLGLLPTSGYGGGSFSFFVLPSVTLGIPLIALLARVTRSAILDVAQEDYVRTARAKGVPEYRVQYRHVLRNALIPVLTIGGLQLGVLLANTVVVETIFSWPGIGSLLVPSIFQRDFPVVLGVVLVFCFGFMVINLIVDVLYVYVDPRIRYG